MMTDATSSVTSFSTKKLFKKSHYIVSTKHGDGFRIFSTKTGAVVDFNIDDSQFRKFEKIWLKETFTLDECEWLQALYHQGFVVVAGDSEDDEIRDYHYFFKKRLESKKVLDLILLPTEDCNFRCIYCYEKFQKGKMKLEVINAVKRFIKKTVPSLEQLNIIWFGGEPFLASDIIQDISIYAIHETEKHGLTITRQLLLMATY